MDNIKDVQERNPANQFFDKQTVRTNPFGKNQSAERAYRRAERIVAGLFLVTNHIPANESLRISVRSNALSILEKVLSLRNAMRASDSPNVDECRTTIRNMISLVRMLSVSGFLSIQNSGVLIEALDDLGGFLDSAKNSLLSEHVSLSRQDFSDSRNIHLKNAPRRILLKDISDTILKDDFGVKDARVRINEMSDKSFLTVRKQGILHILSTAPDLGIKDISSNLPEYSEKMVQRELAELVALGRVKKVGFKRWSRYSIVP